MTHICPSYGTYNITLTIMDSEGLADSARKLIEVLRHDVAMVNVTPSCNWTYQGWLININATIANKGGITETVTVDLYYNITAGNNIGTKIVSLAHN